ACLRCEPMSRPAITSTFDLRARETLRILVCNDDGARAPGVWLLAEAAKALGTDIWVVVPERKWTAAGHQLSFDRDLTLTPAGSEHTFVCSGAPADCVVAAMTILLPDGQRPDLVLA